MSLPEAERVLSSWKEIAAYLGVSVRTAQVWEATRGLPVRRLPGPRTQVRVPVSELEAWRSRDRVEQPPAEPAASAAPLAPVARETRRLWLLAMAGVVLGVGVLLGRVARPASDASLVVVPVTAGPMAERFPDVHPDGDQVVFLTDSADGAVLHHQRLGAAPRVLATGLLGFPRWSRSGAVLSYCRLSPFGVQVVLRTEQGMETPLVTLGGGRDRADNALSSLMTDWLPDDRGIVFADREDGDPFRIMRFSDGVRQAVTTPPAGSEGDLQPAVSPDGRLVAFVRQFTFSESDVFVARLDGGGTRRVTTDNAKVTGIAWLNGHELVFASNRTTGLSSLWRLPVHGGSPELLAGAAGVVNFPRAANGGTVVVYQHQRKDSNVWRIGSDVAARIISSTWLDFNPAFSPDGERIAFVSKRTGSTEIWTARADGTEERALTTLRRGFTDSPRWSPDGAWIAFTSVDAKNRDIYVVPSAGGTVRRFTTWESEEGRPSWSPDGSAVYFRSDRSGKRELWKAGFPDGKPEQVTTTGAYEAFSAPNGDLYLVRDRDQPGLWHHPRRGPERLIIPGVREGRWSLTATGIVFQDFPSRTIKRYDFTSGRITAPFAIPGLAPIEAGMSAHPYDTTVLIAQTDEDTADIMLARRNR